MTTLRNFRDNTKGLQRQFVAEQIGICGKHLNDIEAGRVNLTDNIAKKLSVLYEVNIELIRDMYAESKNFNDEILKKQTQLRKEVDFLANYHTHNERKNA